ncbi:maleylpyruvate isomerase N-terminal domain-containing protein [Nocardia rhamnosiphila]
MSEELAMYLSEVTQGDLQRATAIPTRDVGDLYLHLIQQNLSVAASVANQAVPPPGQDDTMTRETLPASVNLYGGGLEVRYRRTAQAVENAFMSVDTATRRCRVAGSLIGIDALYERKIRDTVLHTWDLAHAMELPYRPDAEIALRLLRTLQEAAPADAEAVWVSVLRLSGRAVPARQ